MTDDEWAMVLVCTKRGRHSATVMQEVVFHGALTDITPEAMTRGLPSTGITFGPCSECGYAPAYRYADERKLAVVAIGGLSQDTRRVVIDLSMLGR